MMRVAAALALTLGSAQADEAPTGARVIGTVRAAAAAGEGLVTWTQAAKHRRRRRRLQPPPPGCPGGTLQKCMDACPSTPLPVYQACVKECGQRCPPPGPPPMNTLDIVAVDPATLAVSVLATDMAGDILNTGSFGAVGGGKYFTLMQPNNTGGIHLASFDLLGVSHTKTIVPLPTTIVDGGCEYKSSMPPLCRPRDEMAAPPATHSSRSASEAAVCCLQTLTGSS